jgi:Domain of unknown function (DUF4226)
MGFLDIVEDILFPGRHLLEGARALFGGHPHENGGGPSPQERVNRILYGGNGAPAAAAAMGPLPLAPPPVPGGPSGLQQGADQAGTTYQQAGGAVAATDEKLAGLLKQIFASNDAAQSKIAGIINDIETKHQQLAADPQLASDPHALAWFQQWVDGKLGNIQQLLDGAKVDSKKQAELLSALGDEYRNNAGGGEHPKDGGNSGGSGGNNGGDQGGGAGAGGSGGDPGGGAAGDPGAGAPGGLTDPLAGLGGLPGVGAGDPLSMLGPALAGLGSAIPGALGGPGGALPMDALGGLAPLAGELASGHGNDDGFSDDGSRDHTKPADFVDDGHDKSDAEGAHTNDEGAGNKSEAAPASSPAPQAAQPAPMAAAPASAAGDPGRVVQMPDGTPVTAPSAQNATAMRAVLNGSTVTDAWKQANVDLPPPGTPVTAPADPSQLAPGEIAQFKTRDPVMYMGNGKIWLDGQLQPQTAVPTAEFLGWVDPAQQAGVAAVPSAAAKPSTAGT